jgi:hypothetical protein
MAHSSKLKAHGSKYFWMLDAGYQIPDTGYQGCPGCRILDVGYTILCNLFNRLNGHNGLNILYKK